MSSSRLTRISAISPTGSSSLFSGWTDVTLREGSKVARENLRDRLREWRHWLWGTDFDGKKVFMGRNLFDLFLLVLAHTIFLVALTVLGVVCMGLLFWLIDWNFPMQQGPESFLQTPGIGFRPQTNIRSNLIRFSKTNSTTYTHLIDDIESFLRYYENKFQQGENFIDCNEVRTARSEDLDKVCRFDLIELGTKCTKQLAFGYYYGQPCVLLKLNKVFDWMPEAYTNFTVPDNIRHTPDGQELWSQWWITVTCEGETATDRENIGPILYYPAQGFHFKHFPFRNQQGYRSPLVFVRFDNPHPSVLIMVTCKAWAKNIHHDVQEMTGMVHFELLMD